MSAPPRTSREVPAEGPANGVEFVENFALLYKKGVECMAELQSRGIDCAVQHNKEAAELWKQAIEKLPWMPKGIMFDGLAGTLERVADVQKAAVNLGVDQARLFVDMVKERTAAVNKTADTVTKFAQQSLERSITAQKKVAEATVAQTRSAYDHARERFPVPGGEALAESIRKGVGTVIDAQKELLEAVAS